MSGNTDLPLGGLVEFVQISCAPFPSKLTEVARFRFQISRRRSRSDSETTDLATSILNVSTLPKSGCVVHHAFLKKNTTDLGRCGSELVPQLRILESYYQSIQESFTSALESNCLIARRLNHFASRNIHREVHLPLPRTASESNCRCCRDWFPV